MLVAPAIDALTAPYWEGAQQHELRLQVCQKCGSTWHPPEPICPVCQSTDIIWKPSSGRGTIYTYTIVHHATHPAFVDQLPYNVALIDLKEGPRIIANVRCANERLACGIAVKVIFEDHDGFSLPQFVPAD